MSASHDEEYEGSCLCQTVQYAAAGPLGSMGNCYCADCRKGHSAAFATFIGVPRARFTYREGEGELRRYAVRPGVIRTFCGRCSSILTWECPEEPGMVFLAAGTLDTPLERVPEYHIFVESKPHWHEIRDERPQYKGHRPPGVRRLG